MDCTAVCGAEQGGGLQWMQAWRRLGCRQWAAGAACGMPASTSKRQQPSSNFSAVPTCATSMVSSATPSWPKKAAALSRRPPMK